MKNVAGDDWKNIEEIGEVRQMLNFKHINNKVMDIFKNTTKMFNAMCQKYKMKFKVSQLRVEEKLKF